MQNQEEQASEKNINKQTALHLRRAQVYLEYTYKLLEYVVQMSTTKKFVRTMSTFDVRVQLEQLYVVYFSISFALVKSSDNDHDCLSMSTVYSRVSKPCVVCAVSFYLCLFEYGNNILLRLAACTPHNTTQT